MKKLNVKKIGLELYVETALQQIYKFTLEGFEDYSIMITCFDKPKKHYSVDLFYDGEIHETEDDITNMKKVEEIVYRYRAMVVPFSRF